ncbi:MAG: GIY-YIG nuclease family protein, partial [Selenomonadaceae bacterium]|nr:GIY-YIG nuclease family protein [Selenomonadaceae bacterium]
MAKTISLFLLDDKANGRLKCSINGRSGIIFRIPRKDLSKSKDRSELKYDGIYFLLGEEDGREKIYVGQASSRKSGNGILGRLSEHDRNGDKNFWTEAIVFTTTDNSFGSTEISWLENKFCNMAIKAARCLVV